MRCAALLFPLVLAAASLPEARAALHTSPVTDSTLNEGFSVDTNTMVPGRELTPGDYKIAIIEHLSDRVILQITNKSGKILSTFLGIMGPVHTASVDHGPINWSNKDKPALRGYSFPGASSVEFVYPKGQAVTIAKSNDDKVLAIDPASDNLPSEHNSLSTQDMQIVTLWSLKASRIGANAAPAIEAARYQVPPQTTAAPVYVARATPPTPTSAAQKRAPSAQKPAPDSQVAGASRTPLQDEAEVPQQPRTDAPVARKHAIAALPHTASDLPLMLLGAVLALFGAAALRIRRIYAV